MLVLMRKLGEKIVIGDNIVLTVIEIRGRQVRLGIVAPQSVRVDRAEIRERMQQDMNPTALRVPPAVGDTP